MFLMVMLYYPNLKYGITIQDLIKVHRQAFQINLDLHY